MGDVKLELWKDADGVRLALSRDKEAFEFDLSYETTGKLICILDEFISDQPDGSYGCHYFEVSDE